MTNEHGMVRSIAWRDLCPWMILFRLYRLSVSVQLLLLAFLGAWAASAGWRVCGSLCLSEASRSQPVVARFVSAVSDWPDADYSVPSQPVVGQTAEPVANAAPVANPAASPAEPADAQTGGPLARYWHGWLGRTPMYAIMEPIRRWFDPTIRWDQFAFYFLGGLWSLLVWSFVGGAITRTAAVRLGRDERVGLRESLQFSGRKLASFLGAPLLPLAAIFALGVPLFVLGLLMRLNLGVALGGLLWLPVGLIGFSMALFAVGVMFGWPLMWSAISTEGSDSFDAISRSYAYTYQRPLQYLVYFLLALGLGFLGWLIVGLFCQAIVQFALLAVGTGSGATRMLLLREALAGSGEPSSVLLGFGVALIGFVNRCVLGIQLAFSYSFMWSAAAAVYLLLRQHADQTEMDDVYLDEDRSVSYGLPPITLDEAGVPGAGDLPELPGTSPDAASTAESTSRTAAAPSPTDADPAAPSD
jgi:hypothetical protein